MRLRRGLTKLRQRTTDRSGSFDVTSGPEGPAGFQRQDGIGRRLLGKGRRVRSVIPAWRGQRTATNQNGRRPSWTAWGALSLMASAAVQPKTNICTCGFSNARPLAAPAPRLEGRSPVSGCRCPMPTGRPLKTARSPTLPLTCVNANFRLRCSVFIFGGEASKEPVGRFNQPEAG